MNRRELREMEEEMDRLLAPFLGKDPPPAPVYLDRCRRLTLDEELDHLVAVGQARAAGLPPPARPAPRQRARRPTLDEQLDALLAQAPRRKDEP